MKVLFLNYIGSSWIPSSKSYNYEPNTHADTKEDFLEHLKFYFPLELSTNNFNIVLEAMILKKEGKLDEVAIVFDGKEYYLNESGSFEPGNEPRFYREYMQLLKNLESLK